jgi:hypothetical protein
MLKPPGTPTPLFFYGGPPSTCLNRFSPPDDPNTLVYGHGEVNPGHREADEDMTVVNAIRRERAEQIRQPKTADTHGSPL